jgi:cytochrome c biogenesis protein CcmG, thiol:disulfide interchange protein DsbE
MLKSKGFLLLMGGLLVGSIIGGIVFLTGPIKNATDQTATSVVLKAGSVMPDFALKSLDTSTVHLNQYLGKPVIVNFWASWCIPCRDEMALFERYYQYQNGNLIVIGVNYEEPIDIVRPFVLGNQITFPVLLDEQGKIRDQFMIRGFPTSLFINSKGIFVAENIGALDDESIKSYLQLIGVKI